MTPIEIIALIVAIVMAVKIIVLLVKPKAWMNLVHGIYKNKVLTMIISLILALLVLNYLLEEITIVQIFAVMAFIALMAAMTMSAHFSDIKPLIDKMLKDKSMLKHYWLPVLLWLVLLIWAVLELLGFGFSFTA